MDTRRDFLKKAALLSGGTGILSTFPPSIQKALAIDPDRGTTFYDAEHVVLLMQENRSFDHLFGTLQGVRGFNDPRAIRLPDKNLVWLQSNNRGETYLPFRLDIKDTKATWMSSLPHSWGSQVDARNGGRHDRWLEAKRSGNKEYRDIPLTLGHYTREDLPFYYALADAFTVCDQHFCASLTATTPNRLFFWTGTVREKPAGDSPANVLNSDVYYNSPANWSAFPERLEDNGISWKIYQNELSVGTGLSGEEDSWLANYTDNPLEWFTQYEVRFSPAHIQYLTRKKAALIKEIKAIENNPSEQPGKRLKKKKQELEHIGEIIGKFSAANFNKLSQRDKNLHNKAFVTNARDPYYHQLTPLQYEDNGTERKVNIPKGDILYQFRKDVKTGDLPTVSWLVAPENFSDHPSAPWYGAWYVSEVLDILTQNPEVWKKTIFILIYDENDGYFDHIPPFVAPEPDDPKTGFCSKGIHTEEDYITKKQADALKGKPKDPGRVSPIGLGYRVPLVVASPWSRGGWVNSEVFDNTSVLEFLENFLTKKTGKEIRETNISAWRRTVCGDMTSVFRPYNGEKTVLPAFIKKDPYIEHIYNARFKRLPSGYKPLTRDDIALVNRDPAASPLMSQQEKGIRRSCALPYQLYAEGALRKDRNTFKIQLAAKNKLFGKRAAGAPFTAYALDQFSIRNYAVAAGDQLTDTWDLGDFENGLYHLRVFGPNGFFREFRGDTDDPFLIMQCDYEHKSLLSKKPTGNIELRIKNTSPDQSYDLKVTDNAYKTKTLTQAVPAGESKTLLLDLKKSFGWYDFTIHIQGAKNFTRRYAGRVETGEHSFSDPAMGRVV